jgi:hypothetical protein
VLYHLSLLELARVHVHRGLLHLLLVLVLLYLFLPGPDVLPALQVLLQQLQQQLMHPRVTPSQPHQLLLLLLIKVQVAWQQQQQEQLTLPTSLQKLLKSSRLD